jgi:membrane associated rhomboid family serine protease
MENNKILWGSENNAVIALLSINLVVFATLRIILIVLNVTPQMNPDSYFGVVKSFSLATPGANFITKPWTIVTYFFTHTSYLLLVSNLCWLFLFSYIMQYVQQNAHIIPVYIYGGLLAGVFIVIGTTITNTSLVFEGCTTGILGIAGFLLGNNVKQKLLPYLPFGGIPIWTVIVLLAVVTIIINLNNNWVIFVSYLAALSIGFIYAKQLQNGNNFGNWMHQVWDLILGKNFVVKQNK